MSGTQVLLWTAHPLAKDAEGCAYTYPKETGSYGLDRKPHMTAKVICAPGHTMHIEEPYSGEFGNAGIRSITPCLLSC